MSRYLTFLIKISIRPLQIVQISIRIIYYLIRYKNISTIFAMISELIKFRRDLHQYPQTSNKQVHTTAKIKNMAIKLGVKQDCITIFPTTGLWIDIQGKAESADKKFCICLRADIDALDMDQNNDGLTYKSVNKGAAHMCGHDGHAACLLALIPLLLSQINHIPSNKSVRLLFQPAQESVMHCGAIQMIDYGCLQNVDQIYGYHNGNVIPLGQLWCKEGPIMSQMIHLIIQIYGEKKRYQNYQQVTNGKKSVLDRAVLFYKTILDFIIQIRKKQGQNFVCSLPIFQTINSNENKLETVRIEGSIRTYSEQAKNVLISKFNDQLHKIQKEGFTYNLSVSQGSVLINQLESTQNILRLARQSFQKVGPGKLPIRGSQDFAFYLKKVPGAYFCVGGGDEQHQGFCHQSNYNFNDKLIQIVSTFWMKLVTDRFKLREQ